MTKQIILQELREIITRTENMIKMVESLPDPDEFLDETEVDFMARTIWGEARNQSDEGMEAVGHVIKNRMENDRFPNTIEKVVTQPWQFSVWNDGNINLDKMLKVDKQDAEFARAYDIARAILQGVKFDLTKGADHYHEKSIRPYWADGNKATKQIGDHIFYRLL